LSRKKYSWGVFIGLVVICFYVTLPTELFKDPTSTIVYSKEGRLLGAKIAEDGQWRFPDLDSVPSKFEKAIVLFEDQYFYWHPGFNPIAIGKAFFQNLKAGRIVRGGSTLTQQVVRMSRKGGQRTYTEKFKEFFFALQLECSFSKKELLNSYASHAPFGGNVVGLSAAAWRYFGQSPENLSWGEAATLAVLPNAPSLIYPGKNQKKLKRKRDRLLLKLYENQYIDSLTYRLSIQELLPQKPHTLPSTASHLLAHLSGLYPQKKIKSSIDSYLQEQVNTIVAQQYQNLKQNEIHNMSVLVLDVHTRKVLAYVGNTPTDKSHQKDVNIIHKPRSTGSILKPFLYAAALDTGEILPHTLLPDIPTQIASYTPKNFNLQYDGAVPASRALSRSLNVPAVKLLQQYGQLRFYSDLQKLGLKDIRFAADHYGLSLILGGAESNLWDLCAAYAAFSGTLNHYDSHYGAYRTNEFVSPSFLADESIDFGKTSKEKTIFGAGTIYSTFKALKEVNRPEGNEQWRFFDSSKEIAWKTGTSFGFRDAWAIGSTKDYVVGVWVGNADGEGRPGLVGVSTAGPVLFSVFDLLPKSTWFAEPSDAMTEVKVCKESGYIAREYCKEVEVTLVPEAGVATRACPFHHWVHVDKEERFQVNSSCQTLRDMKGTSWFVLPPIMEHYYRKKNPFYKVLPPFRMDCQKSSQKILDFVYPNDNETVFLPKGFDGAKNLLLLKVAHSIPDTDLFWYVNEQYMGQTKSIHELSVKAMPGPCNIIVVDRYGNESKRNIIIAE
jgi:penicillin-binding protein 1C